MQAGAPKYKSGAVNTDIFWLCVLRQRPKKSSKSTPGRPGWCYYAGGSAILENRSGKNCAFRIFYRPEHFIEKSATNTQQFDALFPKMCVWTTPAQSKSPPKKNTRTKKNRKRPNRSSRLHNNAIQQYRYPSKVRLGHACAVQTSKNKSAALRPGRILSPPSSRPPPFS